jgi:DNA-binding XRE family transcriptional regulator
MAVMVEKKKLFILRIDAGFDSQQALANAAELNVRLVWNAENERQITWKTARKIVNALRAKGMEVEIEDIDWNVKETH